MIALIGIALAAYDTFKAIRERDLKGKQRLLNYWVLVTLVGLVEPFGAKMVSLIIPGFFLLRAVFQFFFYIPSGFSFAVQGDMIQAFDRRLKEAEHHARANLFPFANEYKTKILDSVVLKSSFLLIFLTQVFVSSVSSEKLEQLEVNCLNILKLIRVR